MLESLLKAAGFDRTASPSASPAPPTSTISTPASAPRRRIITFAGHTDVVPPATRAAWSHGAFSGEVKDGFLYGRGAVDMKGGIACSVAAVLQYLADHGGKPRRRKRLDLVPDHRRRGSVSINGTVKLLQWVADRGEKFDHCVLGEPSNARCSATASRSAAAARNPARSIVDGVQGHVAYPHRAANPVPDISRLIVAISDEPLDQGSAQFQASNLEFISVDVGNAAFNVIPARRARTSTSATTTPHPGEHCASWSRRGSQRPPATASRRGSSGSRRTRTCS